MATAAISSLMFGLWFIFTVLLLKPPRSKPKNETRKRNRGFSLSSTINLDSIQSEAKNYGLKMSKKEMTYLILAVFVIFGALALAFKNPFILAAGMVVGVYLPRFILEKYRRNYKLSVINKLTDPLRMIVARLPDQASVTKSIEITRNEMGDGIVRSLFSDYLSDVNITGSVEESLNTLKNKVSYKKFDAFIENLIVAHYDGCQSNAAIKALEKSVEAIEMDLQAIEQVYETSKSKKRALYKVMAISICFPIVLSAMNTGNSNVYLSTLPGKILIFLYIIGSIYVYVKSEEYLSLNLDEL